MKSITEINEHTGPTAYNMRLLSKLFCHFLASFYTILLNRADASIVYLHMCGDPRQGSNVM